MTMRNTVPVDQERPFEPDELFFSTTDGKGVILSGNDVFCRVSGYSVDELLGAPHNIIRHPDMPRAVFKLLWDFLDRKKAFAGYVKNMANDGRYYWVTALVVPIPGGFLSVRFKPMSPILPIVKSLYGKMLEAEQRASKQSQDRFTGMQKATELLLNELKAKGFNSYDSFMHTMLAAEMGCHRAHANKGYEKVGSGSKSAEHGSRDEGQGTEASRAMSDTERADLLATYQDCCAVDSLLDELFSRVANVLDLIQKLDGKSDFLLKLARDIRLISINAITGSYRLNESGRGIAVVTQDLSDIMKDSTQLIGKMTEQITLLTGSLRELAFTIAAAKLQVQMTTYFMRELLGDTTGLRPSETHTGGAIMASSREIQMLVGSFSDSVESMVKVLPTVEDSIRPLVHHHELLAETFRRLNVVRVTGKVQSSYVPEASRLEDLFDSIFRKLQIAETEMAELSTGIRSLNADVSRFQQAGIAVGEAIQRLSVTTQA